jgi:ribulose-5-phosphate 4-epimerase/fuculose-1-phosphate aldolase
LKRPVAPDPAGWCIHGSLHAGAPQARVILHLHPPYATAVSCLADPEIKPIDQTTARYYNRVAIDLEFGGIADNMAEGRRILGVLGNRKWMMMGGHGVLVAGDTVAEAYHDLYYLERACQTLTLARANGTPLNMLPHEVAERTAEGWTKYTASAYAHFDEMKAILDEKDPSYAE